MRVSRSVVDAFFRPRPREWLHWLQRRLIVSVLSPVSSCIFEGLVSAKYENEFRTNNENFRVKYDGLYLTLRRGGLKDNIDDEDDGVILLGGHFLPIVCKRSIGGDLDLCREIRRDILVVFVAMMFGIRRLFHEFLLNVFRCLVLSRLRY